MIKLFLADCDATLTDGIYHTTEKGEISKNFFTRDFHGLWMLNQAGVKIGIITASSDDVIDQQCRRCAKYAEIIKGTKDKFKSIEDRYVWSSIRTRILWDEIAYIGDDVFDTELLSAVGLCACPRDADESVRDVIFDRTKENLSDSFESKHIGGRGCVREFAEYVLAINRLESNDQSTTSDSNA